MDQGSNQFVGQETGPVGERLASARNALGLSIDDIAERTRVPKRHLMAIEAGSAEGLPALTYSAGFVRSYARLVGLDPEACAQEFRAGAGQPVRRDAPAPYEPADPARIPSRLLAIVALLIAVAIGGGYAVWRGDGLFGGGAVSRERVAAGTDPASYPPPDPAPVAAAAQVTPLPAPVTPAASADGLVAVTATEDAWVKISDGKRTLFMGVLSPGRRIEIARDAVAPVIRTSRAQSLKVTVGDTMMQPLAPPDTLVRAASLGRADLLARPAFRLRAAPLAGNDRATDAAAAAPRR